MTGSPQTDPRELKPGTKVVIKHRPTLGGEAIVYRVMAVAKGWAMLRYPGAIPFAEAVKNLEVWDDR